MVRKHGWQLPAHTLQNLVNMKSQLAVISIGFCVFFSRVIAITYGVLLVGGRFLCFLRSFCWRSYLGIRFDRCLLSCGYSCICFVCSVYCTQACGSKDHVDVVAMRAMSETLDGPSVDEKNLSLVLVIVICRFIIEEECSMFHAYIHCSMLAEDAIKSAVRDYKEKQAKANANS
ncbi:predicted protein [Arabidopsis lyrata subsp. lyrata]|uniref:Predicted protein n=1 Tax=Arabidopsis lyrata subsp. lyrata TaxID=81972 RepID=D7L128_ARALL|nr:predicted protein [Arabidopsis lyrata subsp. lyrata]